MTRLAELHIDPDRLHSLIEMAKDEDLGHQGDITTHCSVFEELQCTATIVARQTGIVAGLEIVPCILGYFDKELQFEPRDVTDGDNVDPGDVLGVIRGERKCVLAAERTVLNFLQHLSGVATETRKFVACAAEYGVEVYDTRKTIPGFRDLHKYAVQCGGGKNHRHGLYDAILVKDNHLADVEPDRLANHAFEILNKLSTLKDFKTEPAFVEFEVDSLDQLEQLLKVVGIDIILLDNFTAEDAKTAVRMRDEAGLKGKVQFEVSGGVTLDRVQEIAATGIERIAVGALTHSAPSLDIAVDIQPVNELVEI